jgi:hypothetical protein
MTFHLSLIGHKKTITYESFVAATMRPYFARTQLVVFEQQNIAINNVCETSLVF